MFKENLKQQIRQFGPMSVANVFSQAIAYYYNAKDPFGTKGDFVTAPEISQVFGEVIGAWIVDGWIKMGAPGQFNLIEIGPGRGTLMSDMLRMIKKIPQCYSALHITLIEQSETLSEMQKETLSGYDVRHIKNITDIDTSKPFILLGNEFLDALPVHQYECQKGKWYERYLDENLEILLKQIPDLPIDGEGVFEISPAREAFINQVDIMMKDQNGICLMIDYGHGKTSFGDTLQAIKNHKFVDVWDSLGEADLTSHVDFDALTKKVENYCYPLQTQGEFLNRIGVNVRAKKLNLPEEDILRLVDPSQMGDLFKVFCFASDDFELKGFVE